MFTGLHRSIAKSSSCCVFTTRNYKSISLITTSSCRTFSSSSHQQSSNNNNNIRSSPRYTIFGEKALLSMQVIPPDFKLLNTTTLVLDNNKKGRILLEWSPRAPEGGILRDQQVRFGLSAEEVGFLLNQLPETDVEFSRRVLTTGTGMENDYTEKVMRIIPKPGGQFLFTISNEKNGNVILNDTNPSVEVMAQLGEYEVIRELMKYSIPAITGWQTQLEYALKTNLENTIRGSGNNQSSSGGYFRKKNFFDQN